MKYVDISGNYLLHEHAYIYIYIYICQAIISQQTLMFSLFSKKKKKKPHIPLYTTNLFDKNLNISFNFHDVEF
jgi:hypothetical protein